MQHRFTGCLAFRSRSIRRSFSVPGPQELQPMLSNSMTITASFAHASVILANHCHKEETRRHIPGVEQNKRVANMDLIGRRHRILKSTLFNTRLAQPRMRHAVEIITKSYL